MTSMIEALKSAQFVVNASGQRVGVQLQPALWEAILTWIESAENMPTVEELTQKIEPATTADRALTEAAMRLSEAALSGVWDNSEDDIYNDL
jgi:hypothetical protein